MTSEITLFEQADEIIASLPVEIQNDPDVSDFVIEALENKISKVEIRTTALEIGQEQLKQAMAQGFNLVNQEIQGIKHEAEKREIHHGYTQKAADNALNWAQKAWDRTQELAVRIATAEAKAEGATEMAKQSRYFGIDPYLAMGLVSVAIVGTLILFVRIEKVPTQPTASPSPESQGSVIKCGVDVQCTYNDPRPRPTRNNGV